MLPVTNHAISQGGKGMIFQQGRTCMNATRNRGVLLLFIASVTLLGTVSARADDDDDDSYTIEQVQACSGDAMRLCKDAIPDVHRIRDCMIAKKAELSKACQAMFR
jgi:hypothetical protein